MNRVQVSDSRGEWPMEEYDYGGIHGSYEVARSKDGALFAYQMPLYLFVGSLNRRFQRALGALYSRTLKPDDLIDISVEAVKLANQENGKLRREGLRIVESDFVIEREPDHGQDPLMTVVSSFIGAKRFAPPLESGSLSESDIPAAGWSDYASQLQIYGSYLEMNRGSREPFLYGMAHPDHWVLSGDGHDYATMIHPIPHLIMPCDSGGSSLPQSAIVEDELSSIAGQQKMIADAGYLG